MIEKVKAHSGYEGNERADKLANDARTQKPPAWIGDEKLCRVKPAFRGIAALTTIEDAVLGRAITSAKYGKARGPDNVDGWIVKKAWNLLHPAPRSFRLKRKPETPAEREAWVRRYIAEYPDVTDGDDVDTTAARLCAMWERSDGQSRMRHIVKTHGQPPNPTDEELTRKERMAKADADALISTLRDLLQHAFTTGEVPRSWGRSSIVALGKKAKVKSGADTRGISLMSHVAKIAARIISRRLNAIPLGQWQCGFRSKKSTVHAAAVLNELLQQYRRRGKPLHCVFIDAKKAFDLTSRSAIDAALEKAGVCEVERELIQNMLRAEIDIIGCDPGLPRLSTSSGVRQGCPASPVYFVIAMDAALRSAGLKSFIPEGHADDGGIGFAVLAYADDLVLIHDDPVALQHNVTKCLEALRSIGLECNVEKTKSLSLAVKQPYHRRRQAKEKYERERVANDVVEPVARTIATITKAEGERKTTVDGVQKTLVFATVDAKKPGCFKCPCCDAHRKGNNSLNRHMLTHGYAAETMALMRCTKCRNWHHATLTKHSAKQCAGKAGTKTCDTCGMLYSTEAKKHFCIGRKLDDANEDPEVVPNLVVRRDDGDIDELRPRAAKVQQPFYPLDGTVDAVTGKLVCFEQVSTFQYLGTTVKDEWDGADCADLRKKVAQGRVRAFKCARFMKSALLPRKSRMLLMQQHVMSATLYGSELWAPTHDRDMRKLYSLQCTCIRWIERLRPTVKQNCTCGKRHKRNGCKCRAEWTYPHNVDVLKRAKQEDIRNQVRRRQWKFAQDVLHNRTKALPERRVAETPKLPRLSKCCVAVKTLYETYKAMARPPSAKESLRNGAAAREGEGRGE